MEADCSRRISLGRMRVRGRGLRCWLRSRKSVLSGKVCRMVRAMSRISRHRSLRISTS